MQLTDGDRIRGLLATYCRLVDVGDFAGVGALMTDAVLRTEDGTPGTQHVVANTSFDEPEPDGSVRTTSTYLVFQATQSVPLQPIVTGTYVDTFAYDDRGWRFTERRFGITHAGVLDQHLTLDPTTTGGSS